MSSRRGARHLEPLRILASCACLLLAAGIPLAAQTVHGELVEEGTGAPIPAVFVVLVDSAGSDLAGSLTDAAGHFVLRAPGAGHYRLRADRIGYASTVSAAFTLSSHETKRSRMKVHVEPVRLEVLNVAQTQVCKRRSGSRQAYELWEEARKALEAANWTRKLRMYRYDAVIYQRALGTKSRRTVEEQTDSLHYAASVPFRSVPVAELRLRGYVAGAPGAEFYYGPDADVLLSDEFQEDHCFWTRRGSGERKGWVGLAFRPIPSRKLPDIKGVLWLDQSTSELRRVEFSYTGLKPRRGVPAPEGRVEFSRLSTGEWIVPKWWIRLPVLARQRHAFQTLVFRSPSFTGTLEQGAYVTAIYSVPRRTAAEEKPIPLLPMPMELMPIPARDSL